MATTGMTAGENPTVATTATVVTIGTVETIEIAETDIAADTTEIDMVETTTEAHQETAVTHLRLEAGEMIDGDIGRDQHPEIDMTEDLLLVDKRKATVVRPVNSENLVT
jgi:hypothetical protein